MAEAKNGTQLRADKGHHPITPLTSPYLLSAISESSSDCTLSHVFDVFFLPCVFGGSKECVFGSRHPCKHQGLARDSWKLEAVLVFFFLCLFGFVVSCNVVWLVCI